MEPFFVSAIFYIDKGNTFGPLHGLYIRFIYKRANKFYNPVEDNPISGNTNLIKNLFLFD